MKDCSEEDVGLFVEEIKRLKFLSDIGLENVDCDIIYEYLPSIFTFSSFLVSEIKFKQIFRVTVNRRVVGENRRINRMSALKYPPKEKVKNFGRANIKNQSVLYGTFDVLTALNELKPNIGDLISVSQWQLINNTPLIFTPIFKRWQLEDGSVNLAMHQFEGEYKRLSEAYPKNVFKQIDVKNEFVADEFTKEVNRKYPDNYLFSAYFSDIIFNKFQTENGKDIEAILYPSVQSKGAFDNIAIIPDVFDSNYRLVNVKESIVIKTPTKDNPGYFLEGINNIVDIDEENSTIKWNKNNYQSDARIREHIENYKIKLD